MQKISGPETSVSPVSLPLHFIIVTDEEEKSNWFESVIGGGWENFMEITNSYYTNGLQFHICGFTVIADDDLVEFTNPTEWQALWDLYHVDNAINVYLVDAILHNGLVAGTTPFIEDPWNNCVVIAK